MNVEIGPNLIPLANSYMYQFDTNCTYNYHADVAGCSGMYIILYVKFNGSIKNVLHT